MLTEGGGIKSRVINQINEAQKALSDGYALAVNAQPLAADIPCIQELAKVAKDLTGILQAVSKLRGL